MAAQGPKSQSVLSSLGDKVAITGARFQGGDSQALHVAIIKATNHDEVVPKEKHVRTLKQAVSGYSSRAQVVEIIQGLNERLKSTEWLIVLKTQMVYHRLFREADVTFLEEFCQLEKGKGLLVMDNFTDPKPATYDYSAFVRSFSLYLNQRKELYKAIRYDSDRDNSENSMILGFPSEKILQAVPMLHKLLQRVVNCVPEGKAARNSIVQSAVVPLVRECLRVYRTAQEGLVKLIDVFFEMDSRDAMKTVQIYREALELHERMLDYFQKVQSIPDLGSQVHMPNLQPLPSDFLNQMEEYVTSSQQTNNSPQQQDQPTVFQQPTSTAPKAAIRSKTMQNAVPVSAGTSVLTGGAQQQQSLVMQSIQKANSDLMKMSLKQLDELPEVSEVGENTQTPSPELDPFGESEFQQQQDPFAQKLTQNNDPFDPFSNNPSDPFTSNSTAPTATSTNAFIQDPFQPSINQPTQQQIDPFLQDSSFPPQTVDPFTQTNGQNVQNGQNENAVLAQPTTETTDPFQSDPFGDFNNFQVQVESSFVQQQGGQQTQNPFATVNLAANSAPSSGPSSGSTTMRRKKDPLELLNEELGIISKEPPKPVVTLNQMKQMK